MCRKWILRKVTSVLILNSFAFVFTLVEIYPQGFRFSVTRRVLSKILGILHLHGHFQLAPKFSICMRESITMDQIFFDFVEILGKIVKNNLTPP